MNATAGQFLQPILSGWLPWLYTSSYWWTAFGFLGNALFGSRFLLQWLASEKRQQVVVPASFWHLSFWGSLINLFYALHIDSAPFIFGIAALPAIYGRNLFLLYRKPRAERAVTTRRPPRREASEPLVAA
jgi:lipid-A-disaccharide synthase-like uncharacterized protein